VGHRITGRYPGAVNRHHGIGREFVHVCIDDASRIAFVQVLADQRKESAVAFLGAAGRVRGGLYTPVAILVCMVLRTDWGELSPRADHAFLLLRSRLLRRSLQGDRSGAPRRFNMSTFSNSYVSRVLFATPASGLVLGAPARRWRRLMAPLFDPYRPELHYMRGPGPKWREKHARGAGFAS
jgi:hypothetical protein